MALVSAGGVYVLGSDDRSEFCSDGEILWSIPKCACMGFVERGGKVLEVELASGRLRGRGFDSGDLQN